MFDGNAMSFVIQEITRFNNNSNDEFLEYFYKSTKTEIGMRQEKHDFSFEDSENALKYLEEFYERQKDREKRPGDER